MEEAADVLEAVARKRALVGSDTLLIFLLKAVRPWKFRERYEVRSSGTVKVEHKAAREILRDPEARSALEGAADRLRLEEKLARMPAHLARRMAKAFPEYSHLMPQDALPAEEAEIP